MSAVDAVEKKVEDLSVKDGEPKKAPQKPSRKERKAAEAGGKGPGSLYLEPQPAFIDSRVKLFDELKAKYDAEVASKERKPIQITLKDGSVKEGTSYETSPMEIATLIGKSFAERQVISKV